jgi:hypothetical protein
MLTAPVEAVNDCLAAARKIGATHTFRMLAAGACHARYFMTKSDEFRLRPRARRLQSWIMAGGDDSIRSRVREVLLRDWDPHNAGSTPAAAGTYDGYIGPLLDLLRGGAGEDEVVEFLHQRERESMCFPSLGTQRLRPVARKLLKLSE